MKKTISIILVAILLVHLVGFYVYFVVRLGELRMVMRHELALLPHQQLEKIILPLHAFKLSWLTEREMEWKGKMFDIARIEKHADRLVVYARHDKAEDNLLAFITRVIDISSHDKNPAPGVVVQFFTLKFVTVDSLFHLQQNHIVIVHCSPYLPSTKTADLLPEAPPPRV